MNAHAATFEQYYRASEDPWGFRTRWYERRKRALLLATLPRATFASAWEIGCSNGELAAALAPRCDRLLATDGNETAVQAAQARLSDFARARVRQLWVPEQWPTEKFDLIIVSELAYYLDEPALNHFCRRLATTLSPGGTFLACHWRPAIDGCALTGIDAHRILEKALPWTKTARHLEADFTLETWSDDERSVAQMEGLR